MLELSLLNLFKRRGYYASAIIIAITSYVHQVQLEGSIMSSERKWQDQLEASLNHVTKLKNWEEFFLRAPCVHYSFLLGGTCGSLTFAHKLRIYRGNYKHAFNSALLVTVLATGVSFYLCNSDQKSKRDTMKQTFADQNIKEK